MLQQHLASPDTLKAIFNAFNAHDLDAIMEYFADDCSLDMPRGPKPWGARVSGKSAVRGALATRFVKSKEVLIELQGTNNRRVGLHSLNLPI